MVWEAAELGVAIIAVSIPFARLAVKDYLKRKRAKSAGHTTSQASGTRGTSRPATSESAMARRDDCDAVVGDNLPLARRQTNPKANDGVRSSTACSEQFSLEQFLREAPEMPGAWRESRAIVLTREFSVGSHRRDISDEEEGFRAWSPPPPTSNV